MGEVIQGLPDKKNSVQAQTDLARRIGYDLLGPIVHRWLLALQQHLYYFDDGRTKFLFCARAGVRIEKLYRIFRSGFSGSTQADPDLFWISRVSVAKGTYGKKGAKQRAVSAIAREYHNHPLSELVAGLLRNSPDVLTRLNLKSDDLQAHGFNFSGWITVKGSVQEALRSYLEACTEAFDDYVAEVLADAPRAVLIDSGWQGSAQSLLTHAFPKTDWKGLYFGRILSEGHDAAIVSNVIGLMFEAQRYDPSKAESAFVRHRHLIECLLEPNGPSIEEVPSGPFLRTANEMIAANLAESPDPEKDALYLDVERYLRDHADLPISAIVARHQSAMPEMARIIVTPSRAEAAALRVKDRSADFGKTLMVPVVQLSGQSNDGDKDQRIRQALWQEGQIALEYDGGIALDLQKRLNGLVDDAVYFDPCSVEKGGGEKDTIREVQQARVAIITRTKNRPVLLERAALSVARQTFGDYIWVVVNDGGDEEPVRAILENSLVDRRRLRLVSNPESIGMEAASNVGIRACSSEFIIIHDDDDSWATDFLEKTVRFLDSVAGARYGGVISHSIYVSEEIRGDKIIEHGRSPYHDWVRNVQLSEMACGNFFPPIAFLFRRSVWEKVGGYNESLPVLGDWFFNLEFLLHADIGVLPEPLAFYHHRDRGDSRSGIYANSVIGGRSKHEEFGAVARNAFLRRHAQETTAALSVVLGYMMSDIRGKVGSMSGRPAGSAGSVGHDQLDLYWAAAQVNRIAAERLFGIPALLRKLIGKGGVVVDPGAGWEEVLGALRRLNAGIPAPPDFDEGTYLAMNSDVAGAVAKGKQRSGYIHYLLFGRSEGRSRPGKGL